jgi:translation initiation factor IF-3
VRLIGEGGENTLMFTRDAIALAQQRGLDLVEVAPNEVPPVCKLMDYGKFRYDQTKKDRDSRKLQKQVVLKEVRFSPKIDDHDIETKSKMVRRFLDDGNKVKLTVRFKGREMAHPNLGRDVLDQVRTMLGDNLVVEAMPKMEGKSMTMVVSLKPPKNAPARQPRPAVAQEGAPGDATVNTNTEAPTASEAEPVGAGVTAEK